MCDLLEPISERNILTEASGPSDEFNPTSLNSSEIFLNAQHLNLPSMSNASAVFVSEDVRLQKLLDKKKAAAAADLEKYGNSFEEWLATDSHDSSHLSKKISCPHEHAVRSADKKKSLQKYCKGMSLFQCDRIYTSDDRIFLLLQFSGTHTG
jgi:hypothetical protein